MKQVSQILKQHQIQTKRNSNQDPPSRIISLKEKDPEERFLDMFRLEDDHYNEKGQRITEYMKKTYHKRRIF